MTTSAIRGRARRHWTTQVVNVGLALFAASLVSVAVGVLSVGFGYYTTPELGRAEHPLDAVLRSGRLVGLWLGIAGTTLMVAMLSYTARKSLLRWSWLGSPGHWLRFHIICGVMGPVFIVLHTAFVWPTGLTAIGFWCMVLVALSGGFGRYVYGHFPRTAAGRSEDLRSALEALADLRAQLVAQTAEARGEDITQAIRLARDVEGEVHSIPDWIRLDVEVRRRRKQIRTLLRSSGLPPEVQGQVAAQLGDQLVARRNVEAWAVTGKLFKWWHLFHEPLAKAMYIIVFVHVVEAVVIGGALKNLLLGAP